MTPAEGMEPVPAPTPFGSPVGPGQGPASLATAIAVDGIWKSYGHVQALRGASLAVAPGEIVALVGDNGAGKSTLLKVMCGAVTQDAGRVSVGADVFPEGTVVDAQLHGIGVVYQDLALAPDLSVLENIYLGHEILLSDWRRLLGILNRKAMAGEADEALRDLGIELPTVELPVNLLSGGQRQAVAIARAVKWGRQVLLLDEPTAALGTRQTGIVRDLVKEVANQGIAVLMISHDIPAVVEVAHRVVVMRQGAVVKEFAAKGVTIAQIVGAMLGETTVQGEGEADRG